MGDLVTTCYDSQRLACEPLYGTDSILLLVLLNDLVCVSKLYFYPKKLYIYILYNIINVYIYIYYKCEYVLYIYTRARAY